MLSEAIWRLSEASVRGKSHLDSGAPNQDAVAVRTSKSGQVVAAVVSDGAGTAERADVGSRATADFMADRLLRIGEDLLVARLSPDMVAQSLAQGIEALRAHLESTGAPLRDFHCTLAGCVLTGRDSYVCQLGDSIAVTARFAEVSERRIDLFPDAETRIFDAERGEYSNETHFVTEPEWRDHLRVLPLPSARDAVLLMTDGAMDIAVRRHAVFRGFLSNLVAKLIELPGREERNATINDWLADPRTFPITGDDKTMFVAIRASAALKRDAEIYLGDAPAPDDEARARPALPQTREARRAPDGVSHHVDASVGRRSRMRVGFLTLALVISLAVNAYLLLPDDFRPWGSPAPAQKLKLAAKPVASANPSGPQPPRTTDPYNWGDTQVSLSTSDLARPTRAPEVAKAEPKPQDKVARPQVDTEVISVLEVPRGETRQVVFALSAGNYARLMIGKLQDDCGRDAKGTYLVSERSSCELKGERPTCTVRIRADKKALPQFIRLTVGVKDDNDKDWTLEVPIAVAGAKAPAKDARECRRKGVP